MPSTVDPETYLAAIADYPVYFAHNANVDAIERVDETLETALEPPQSDTWPEQLTTTEELARAISMTMASGHGDMLSMDEALAADLESRLQPDEQRLGGQAGIMADLLSLLGGDPILFTYMLSARQRALFERPAEIRFPVVEDGRLRFVPLTEVTNAERTKINWIFEFADGDTFFDATATVDSRFIAAARPEQFDLETGDLATVADQLGDAVGCALLSGYQSLKREYDDGTTFREHVASGREFLQQMNAGSDVTLQLEYGVTHKEPLRRAIIREIVPEMDAIGMDTRELQLLVEDVGLLERVGARQLDRHGRQIVKHYEQLDALLDRLPVACLKLHTTDYFLAVMTDDYLDPSHVRHGWAFAALVAASKATLGEIDRPRDLQIGLEYDYTPTGIEAINALADHLGVDAPEPALEHSHVVAHPNRVVPDPVSTVGLGDSVAAANFVLENALADRE
jgi:ADP-dependent phosphofructokinase/glucokinase